MHCDAAVVGFVDDNDIPLSFGDGRALRLAPGRVVRSEDALFEQWIVVSDEVQTELEMDSKIK
jgi:hypothetical protein